MRINCSKNAVQMSANLSKGFNFILGFPLVDGEFGYSEVAWKTRYPHCKQINNENTSGRN